MKLFGFFNSVQKTINKSMKTFSQYVKENLDKNLKTLTDQGVKIVEIYKIGNYHIFLSQSLDETDKIKYDVALTSGEKDFMTHYNQTKIPIGKEVSLSDIMTHSKEIFYIIKRWANKYHPIFIGSYNKKRAETYNKILNKWGFKLSEMRTTDKSTGENEGKTNWYFEILH